MFARLVRQPRRLGKLIYWLGIGLGSGLPKRAAGTWGTVGGLVVAIPMLALGFWGFWRLRWWAPSR